MKSKGMVYLVGAGPGDAGLLTLRGAEVLRRAEVVIYDVLVNPDLLRLAPPGAEVISRGKRSGPSAIPQHELNALMIARAREGKLVVRLKGGDPYVFGRGGEEAEELAAARIPFEVVPGISSAMAGPAYAGIPLTHRDYSSSYTVITGVQDPARGGLDWRQIAQIPGTKVILMGVERIQQIAAQLIAHGMPEKTPVAMVRWATTGRQQSIDGTLATIAGVVEKNQFTAPAVTIVGDVVKLRGRLNWFERRPLFGQRIVVTRSREQASELAAPLRELGADVLEIPTIKTAPPTSLTEIADAILGLNSYEWIVFTSPNGVKWFFEYFFKAFEDLRDIRGVRIAAVGPATAARLKELHLKVDLMPEEYVAGKVAGALAKFQSIENVSVLLARAEKANPDLPKQLEELGAIVDDVACYQTVPENEDPTGAAAKLLEGGADWITFTSGSTVENFHARFDLPELMQRFPQIKVASIGPETSKALAALAIKPAIEARAHTVAGLIKSLRESARPA